MKLWTMPRIVVDAFTPNEYVALCKQFAPAVSNMNASGVYYVDIYKGGTYASGDGKYNPDKEKIGPMTSDGGFLADSAVTTGTFSNLTYVYEYIGPDDGPNIDALYADSSLFRIVNNYRARVYVLSIDGEKRAYLYQNTIHRPNQTQAFNS